MQKKDFIYLDNAATTPILPEVIHVMNDVMENCYGNPSSIHSQGREARVVIEKSRKSIANLLNASPSEIIFTSGATESINSVISSCVKAGVKKIITSPLEHHAVLHSAENAAKSDEVHVLYVSHNAIGDLVLESLEALLINNSNALVCLMHANNEIGNLLPLKDVSELCVKYNALFLCDTVQTIGKFNIDLKKIHIDFAVSSAHKYHGPKGVGFLYVNGKNKIMPLITGGTQERNQRAGTENIYGIAGMTKALGIAISECKENIAYISELRAYFISQLEENIPDISFNGNAKSGGLHTIINVLFPFNEKSEMLLFNLDIAGLIVSGGSACSSGVNNPSHVLDALNITSERTSIRFSFSKFTTKEQLNKAINILKNLM